jgi:hypothetical protein
LRRWQRSSRRAARSLESWKTGCHRAATRGDVTGVYRENFFSKKFGAKRPNDFDRDCKIIMLKVEDALALGFMRSASGTQQFR